MKQEKYKIITNVNYRRILIISDVVVVDNEPDIYFEDFDAVFIDVVDFVRDRVMLAIRMASPLLSEKCRFKPCFVTRRLHGWLGKDEVIIDGYAVSPTDQAMSHRIEEIYANMRRHNFLLGTEPVETHAAEFFRLCRFAISRGHYTFASEPIPGLSSGYMELYCHTIWNEELEQLQHDEREYFLRQMLRLGYVRKVRFIDRVHLCPVCNGSHLLFFECCPKCGSSNIKQERVIHHFRCAHVGPESTFDANGELICPKCKHTLRHIGVDYDKPSTIYTCGQCDNTFLYSDMRVTCCTSHRSFKPEDLKPVDVEEYEFTPDGMRAFANYDCAFTIPKSGFLGYMSYTDFCNFLKEIDADSDEVMLVARYRISNVSSDREFGAEDLPGIVKVMNRLYNYKSALHGNEFYFMTSAKPTTISNVQQHMEYELNSEFADYKASNENFQFEFIDIYQYNFEEDVDNFIDRIEEMKL